MTPLESMTLIKIANESENWSSSMWTRDEIHAELARRQRQLDAADGMYEIMKQAVDGPCDRVAYPVWDQARIAFAAYAAAKETP